ncbi:MULTISPECIES: response regulator transcription factor [Francisella]|uniref:DNA-binding response regulator n=1 Tax=Francisella opportunistica TaxID=2016517 RepID=A0A345JTF0_9GAMM|nr:MULTISPECIES: response regulator transcription factor [Francisella]APC92393.1 DNA-binding response regulator KdpE [Francisella sp. MA067296]AXH30596.1 DNA-binding response regulator [Francisella opportunistica]AXH32237.1 DNA-binding response regulator [Francisella opportunistica]AXH33886.1 DNA-binding response regulator [Francisella opportunistica]
MIKKILIVEDEPQIKRLLEKTFLVLGYDVEIVATAGNATKLLGEYHPDVVILDLGLPDQDGQEWLKSTRRHNEIPIIVVSARNDTEEVVKALENGANDYIKKPFDMLELIARVKRQLNPLLKKQTEADNIYTFANLKIDLNDHKVSLNNQDIHLSKKEFLILACLVSHAGKLVMQNTILKEVWGECYGDGAQYLRVYIGQLRKKLSACKKQPLIITENAIGYRFAVSD